ncbi:hypothetical protein [Longimicrobium sp.]|uniref:hypothetical protein n=1 Tax=Longimicrobium sp. TaxID=2029185 RepID=UPI002EDAA5CF
MRLMYRNGYVREGLWAPAKPLRDHGLLEARISATVEALLAISRLRPRPTSGAARSIRELQAIVMAQGERWRAKTIAFWGLSELQTWLSSEEQEEIAKHFHNFIFNLSLPEGGEIKGFFVNRAVGGYKHYISYNPELLIATTALNFIRTGLLGEDVLHRVCPILADVTKQLLSTGVFRSQHNEATHFWEYYHAMLLLDRFCSPDFPHHFLNGEIMYIKPTFFHNKNIQPDDSLCAILMPFGAEWSDDLFAVYRNAVESAGFVAWRSDLEWGDHEIMQRIWEYINKARFVIADCTGRNPNVFYELGIAHTLGKRVFICTQSRTDIPFDIQHITSYVYSPYPNGIAKLQDALGKFMLSVTS